MFTVLRVTYDHYRHFVDPDLFAAHIIRQLRSIHGLRSPCEDIVHVPKLICYLYFLV